MTSDRTTGHIIFRYLHRFNPFPILMASEKQPKKRIKWSEKLRTKYRLVLMNDDTLEERITFRLSRLNVFIALGTMTIILIFLTTILIAFTPLREYIPGYTAVGLQKRVYDLQARADSIERALELKDRQLINIKAIISGENLPSPDRTPSDTGKNYSDIKLTRSTEDSMLRSEIENQAKYSLYRAENAESVAKRNSTIGNILFFSPIKGVITSEFDPTKQHYGVDIVAGQNEAVKSVLDGIVIFSDWTVGTGYVLVIQHSYDIITVYKHNSALMKHQGEMVKAGEPVAIIGESGKYTTGPHLHFELWSELNPVNPKEYISF